LAVNAAALAAAVEFGIQPVLFHDGNGAPLYAPYPLRVAIPAIMIGHLAIAGIAEAVISAGLVAYLQLADPGLLRGTSGTSAEADNSSPRAHRSLERLWITVALLMLLTPLGILAAGKAWGEWSPKAFASDQDRAQIATASQGNTPPTATPEGLQRLSTLWTAPFPAYAPGFVKSPSFGYLMSAVFGVGAVLLLSMLLQLWLRRRRNPGAA
jgi:cobalt/nickel transport system permease protein